MRMLPQFRRAARPLQVLTTAVATLGATAASAETAVVSAPLGGQCEISADVRKDESSACWRVQCTGQAPREIGCDLTALHQIVSIVAAGDSKSLAVLSVGEGHPILEIVPLPALIERGSYDGKCSVNPYPGTIDAGEWRDDQWLIQSDTNLLIEDIEERANAISGQPYAYTVSLPDCKLAAKPRT